ncbi:MAG TPA: hypothetical protein VGI80_07510, partial [Pyrinomonadaceae bacterium]
VGVRENLLVVRIEVALSGRCGLGWGRSRSDREACSPAHSSRSRRAAARADVVCGEVIRLSDDDLRGAAKSEREGKKAFHFVDYVTDKAPSILDQILQT